MSDLHSAHKQALVDTLFAEQGDDPDFRMSFLERIGWSLVKFGFRCRDAFRVLRGRAQVRATYE